MEKQQQFITMVQTAIITKYVCDPGDGTAPVSRPMWRFNTWTTRLKFQKTFHLT